MSADTQATTGLTDPLGGYAARSSSAARFSLRSSQLGSFTEIFRQIATNPNAHSRELESKRDRSPIDRSENRKPADKPTDSSQPGESLNEFAKETKNAQASDPAIDPNTLLSDLSESIDPLEVHLDISPESNQDALTTLESTTPVTELSSDLGQRSTSTSLQPSLVTGPVAQTENVGQEIDNLPGLQDPLTKTTETTETNHLVDKGSLVNGQASDPNLSATDSESESNTTTQESIDPLTEVVDSDPETSDGDHSSRRSNRPERFENFQRSQTDFLRSLPEYLTNDVAGQETKLPSLEGNSLQDRLAAVPEPPAPEPPKGVQPSTSNGLAQSVLSAKGQGDASSGGLQAKAEPNLGLAATDTRTAAKSKQADSVNSATGSSVADRARLVQRVSKAFQRLGPNGGQIRIRMHPPELGSIRLELQIQGHRMHTRVLAESEAALQVLRDHTPELRQRLAEQGMHIERLDVELDTNSSNLPDQNSDRQDPKPFQQHQRQQTPRSSQEFDLNGRSRRPEPADAPPPPNTGFTYPNSGHQGVDLVF